MPSVQVESPLFRLVERIWASKRHFPAKARLKSGSSTLKIMRSHELPCAYVGSLLSHLMWSTDQAKYPARNVRKPP
jgi:hypothetical protein